MTLPAYSTMAVDIRDQDYEKIINSVSLESLCKNLYGCSLQELELQQDDHFLSYVTGSLAYTYTRGDTQNLLNLLISTHNFARENGFPYNSPADGFDIKLSEFLFEKLQELDFTIAPSVISNRDIQTFITQRIFPLIVYWRWMKKEKINADRIKASNRNYFFTMMMTAWLFDKGEDSHNRWEYMDALSADIIVAIIERPGIGYRCGFAQALASKILELKKSGIKPSVIEQQVRGVMKRATFTFSVSVMPDEDDYYRKIVAYLFEWSKINYKAEGDVPHEIVDVPVDNGNTLISEDEQTPEYWYSMSGWAANKNLCTAIDRSFMYQVGNLLRSGRPLSEKQIAWKNRLFEKTRELGFSYEIG